MRDAWWHSGLAGVFPSVACFVIAGTFLFARRGGFTAARDAALAVALLFALNPNILYLQATPMTELLFLASLAALLWATLWFRDSQSLWAILIAAAASNAASLTRYEGWFLIPFVCLYLLVVAKRKPHAILFARAGSAWDRWPGSRTISITTATRSSFTTDPIPPPRSTSASSRREDFAIPAITIGSRPRATTSPPSRWVAGWPLLVLGIAGTLVAVATPCLVAVVPAAAPAAVLRLEHALLRHAHLRPESASIQLVQHALRRSR